MILPNFILHSRKNESSDESGIDSFTYCQDQLHFKNYPYPVSYRYNSRGFRDQEWPNDLSELTNAIWCFGDSFTVGLGSPLNHTWSNILQSRTGIRCINVSMDGASNKWIARKILEVITVIKPKLIVAQWSFMHRDEFYDETLSDEDRRRHTGPGNINRLQINNCNLIKNLESQKNQSQIIHSFIPGSGFFDNDIVTEMWKDIKGPDWPDYPKNLQEFNSLKPGVVKELTDFFKKYELYQTYYQYLDYMNNLLHVPEITIADYARDGQHYDKVTATTFVDQLENLIADLHLT